MGEALAYKVDSSSDIDVHNKVKVIKAEGISMAIENLQVEYPSESIFDQLQG